MKSKAQNATCKWRCGYYDYRKMLDKPKEAYARFKKQTLSNLRNILHGYHCINLQFREDEADTMQRNITSVRHKHLHLGVVRMRRSVS